MQDSKAWWWPRRGSRGWTARPGAWSYGATTWRSWRTALPFEAVCGLLWDGDPERGEALGPALGAARVEAFEQLAAMGDALEAPDGMDALRAALAHLRGDAAEDPLRISAAVGVVTAAWARHVAGAAPLEPDPQRPHAEDVLRMALGREPEPERAAALDAYLVTVAEHGMNASTFTARVVASTGSDCGSAVVAALGALKGPLHGGAPGRCSTCWTPSARRARRGPGWRRSWTPAAG